MTRGFAHIPNTILVKLFVMMSDDEYLGKFKLVIH